MIEDMLKNYEEDTLADCFKVPNLGKHYTQKWSMLDSDSCWDKKDPKGDKKRGLSQSNTPDSKGKNKKTKNDTKDIEKNQFGSLTQRLIQSLLDGPDFDEEDNDSDFGDTNGHVLKNMVLGNTAQLEKRIKKELEENGILDPDDGASDIPEDDEVLRLLVRAQHELKKVTKQSQAHLKHLLSCGKADMAKQELKKKLVTSDEDVMEWYRRILGAKQKKRNPTKKERDAAMKALKERDTLVQQLDAINCI